MLSRAIGGITEPKEGRKSKIVFSLPGSTKAVRLGMEKLIISQVQHIYYEINKHAEPKI